ncbi:MAG TPA: uroporphyrinogen-III C-methyltransferase [Geminicoccaceae bacterium]|nr:uroporphyrinogen-III C-methyltransferase [Geminicoccus sp.]HMU51747.1 uroporphyrinogen-III C-methyltransferase [Geminicoccaceae bacterium]
MSGAERALAAVLAHVPAFEPGHVWLAGAGPGDPGHLTAAVLVGLACAEVIVHDALVHGDVLDLADPRAERIFAGKRGGKPSADQADITATLIARARTGARVLRLKGGDPYIFGRGGEEALALTEAGVPFRVLPGITAGLAGLAAAGIPATMRGLNKAVILATGHAAGTEEDLDWRALARTGQPLVVYMGLKALPLIVAELLAGGMAPDTPAAVVTSATTPDQRVLEAPLAAIAEEAERQALAAPAIVVVGEIVTMRLRLGGRR